VDSQEAKAGFQSGVLMQDFRSDAVSFPAVLGSAINKQQSYNSKANKLRHQTRNGKFICDAVAAILKNTYDIITPTVVVRF